jgi:hypothetical protein
MPSSGNCLTDNIMNPIRTSAELKAAIQQLELEQKESLIAMKQEFGQIQENFNLSNIIKNTFKKAAEAPDLKTNIVNAAIGLTTGIMAKKIIIGKTLNPLSKLLGVALEMFVANKVTKNAQQIRSTGSIIMDKLFKHKDQAEKI